MKNLVRVAILAGALAATMAVPALAEDPQCLDMGPSQPFIGGPVPIDRPTYVDPDLAACLALLPIR
jgi:hypothetical protein